MGTYSCPIWLAVMLLLVTSGGCTSEDAPRAEVAPSDTAVAPTERPGEPRADDELPSTDMPESVAPEPTEPPSSDTNTDLFARDDESPPTASLDEVAAANSPPAVHPAKPPERSSAIPEEANASAAKPPAAVENSLLKEAQAALAAAKVRRAERYLLAAAIVEPEKVSLAQVMRWSPALQKPVANLRTGLAWHYVNPPEPVAEAGDDEPGGELKDEAEPNDQDEPEVAAADDLNPGGIGQPANGPNQLPEFGDAATPRAGPAHQPNPAERALPGQAPNKENAEAKPKADENNAEEEDAPQPFDFAPITTGITDLNATSLGTGSRVVALLRSQVQSGGMGTMMRRAAAVADKRGATEDPAIRLLGAGDLDASLAAARAAECDLLFYAVMSRQTIAPRAARSSAAVDDPRERTRRGSQATTRGYEVRREAERRTLQWRVFRVDTGRELYRSQPISSQSEGEFSLGRAPDKAIGQMLDNLSTYVRQYLALRALPPFQPQSALARAKALSAPMTRDPLAVLAELRLYRELDLIDEAALEKFEQALLGEQGATAIRDADISKRRATVSPWLPPRKVQP